MMTLRKSLIAATIFAGIALGAAAAQAATVTETYDITFNSFLDLAGVATAPIAPVTGSFTLTFDPTLTYTNDTTDIIVNSLNVPVSSAIGFSTTSFGGNYYISIGGIADSAGDVLQNTNDFVLQLRFADINNLSTPSLPLCSDAGFSCGGSSVFYASGYTTTADPQSVFLAEVAHVGVPEPATWAIMLIGLGAVGAALRGRKGSLAIAS